MPPPWPSTTAFTSSVGVPGWNSERIAAAWAELMRRLGYDRYGAQGGDFAAFISTALGKAAPDNVVGVHLNVATYGFIPWGDVSEDAWIVDKFKEWTFPSGNLPEAAIDRDRCVRCRLHDVQDGHGCTSSVQHLTDPPPLRSSASPALMRPVPTSRLVSDTMRRLLLSRAVRASE